jgi:hypothetical protein
MLLRLSLHIQGHALRARQAVRPAARDRKQDVRPPGEAKGTGRTAMLQRREGTRLLGGGCLPLPAGGIPAVAARRPARRPPLPQAGVPAPTLPGGRACASWPGRPPRAGHSLAAQRSHSRALRPAASASVASQPQTLECDLARQAPGIYREDGTRASRTAKYDLYMQRHATFIVALVAAVAAVMPVLWHGSLLAWMVSGVLFAALVVAVAMYFVRRRKQREPIGETNTRPSGPTTVIGDIIGAHDHSIVMGNKIDSNINIYNVPPVQPVPPKDVAGPGNSKKIDN